MDYEQKYKDALDLARTYHDGYKIQEHIGEAEILEDIFSELKESEDEKIRKEIVDFITSSNKYDTNERCEAWLNWLEKQGEHKSVVYAPKFCVGNIVKSKSQPMLDARKIISIDKDCYWCEDKGCIGFAWEDDYKLVEQKKVDPDKVIEWLRENVPMFWEVPCSPNRIIDKFKGDFDL